jgi:hypothetical protein
VAQVAASFDSEGHRVAERYLRILIVGIPLVYLILFALDWNRVGSRDLDQFVVFHQLQYWNHQLFGFAKQWTPVLCSGLSIAGEPQVPLLSLSMMLAYALGPLRGIELAVLLYLIVGWIGAYMYAGLWTAERAQRLLAASLFIGNGFFICRIAYGHIDFVPFLALPAMLWLLHRVCAPRVEPPTRQYSFIAVAILLLAGAFCLAIDGSPVSIIHLLLWVVCYAVALSATVRSVLPIACVMLAVVGAALLDAGYLWPMIAEQAHFPRLTPDTFTNPLALPWFTILPVRGKLIEPAMGNGHELSVFVGPVIAIALWRYRRELLRSLPDSMRNPLIVVSILSIWLGMGSLHSIDVPTWLSPFDWLRPLPGFRSMGVTGRYWGFLALPLSLLGAAALRRFALSRPDTRSLQTWMLVALLFQFGFQIATLVGQALPGRIYTAPVAKAWAADGGESVDYVYGHKKLQGALVTPQRGVIDCYDNDDFLRADMHPGAALVQKALGQRAGEPEPVTAEFVTWDHIRIATVAPLAGPGAGSRIRISLNQAWHRFWRSSDCDVAPDARGNLVATCDRGVLMRGPLDLEFHDPISALGARVSIGAWSAWITAMLALLTIAWRSSMDASFEPLQPTT